MLPIMIRTLRKREGLTQVDLAKKLGVSRSSVCAYEAGTREPSNETLTKMSQIFGCSVDHLLTGKSGLIARRTDEPFVDVSETYDEFGNLIGTETNYNTLFTGTDEENAKLVAYLEALRTRPEMRMLFKVAEDATPEDIKQAVKIIEALRK